ncbi:MAG: SCO4225 family membrane protein [Pseudonocardiaceae bacterium]
MTTHERPRERLARRIAFGYLAVVAAVFTFVAVMVATAQGDPLIAIWLAFVTAPTSFLLIPLQILLLDGLPGPWLPIVGFAFPALAVSPVLFTRAPHSGRHRRQSDGECVPVETKPAEPAFEILRRAGYTSHRSARGSRLGGWRTARARSPARSTRSAASATAAPSSRPRRAPKAR